MSWSAPAGVLVAGPLLMILFRAEVPALVVRLEPRADPLLPRVCVYAALLDDRYPSTDEQQAVHLDVRYPDVPTELNRWLPLVKWLLAIPHYIVLAFLGLARLRVRRDRLVRDPLHRPLPARPVRLLVGVGRWALRVAAYAFLLTTDRYPPFSLSP